MEILSAMKVLIIFLIIFAILFLISIFFKIKVLFSIEVDNLQINTNIKVFGKKFSGKFLFKKQSKTVVKINSSKKKIRLKDTKKNKFDIIKILDFIRVNDMKSLGKLALKDDVSAYLSEILKEYVSYHLDINNLKSESYLNI